jgi:hypothetical protein
MDKEIKNEFENLARMVKTGFDEVNNKFEGRFERLETRVEDGFRETNARLSTIEQDISEIKKHFVYRYEFDDLMARVKYLESKLGVESGK